LQQQQREAALTCLQYEQECYARVATADKWRRHEAAIWEKALADEANEQCCQEVAAHDATLAEMALAMEQFCHKMAQLATMLAKMALARLHEVATLKKALNK
jgi:hypothetical protein